MTGPGTSTGGGTTMIWAAPSIVMQQPTKTAKTKCRSAMSVLGYRGCLQPTGLSRGNTHVAIAKGQKHSPGRCARAVDGFDRSWAIYFPLTVTCLGLADSALGRCTVKTPF